MADGEPQPPSKPHSLQALTAGPVASSVSKLSGSSRVIPSDQDFHFYNNFDEFRGPISQIAGNSQSMLDAVGSSAFARGGGAFLEDTEEAYHRLVDVNDGFLERFDASMDEFQAKDDGFQVVTGKKKKAAKSGGDVVTDVKVATQKPELAFHNPKIPKPQEEYCIYVNNANVPFEHVWLQRAEEGDRYVHPLESLSVLDFVDDSVPSTEPSKPPPVESTAFKIVEDVRDLKEMTVKLRNVDEFAVDLEHNHYRSFQGLTCLIQISTRTEDFVIDTLKLRVHIGPYLREVFKDPTKRKVMHGADRDIVWLQRDFGIYICNLFDTGQASRVMNLERHSLEYLLQHYCGVTAKKEYQTADWRLRPLPEEMLRYAREDTHYLLHIYDLMRVELLSMSKDLGSPNASLVEVYKRSYDICMQLYEKELLSEDSYLKLYGVQGGDLNSQQLAIVSGLWEWRDAIARGQDESTGYVLPNKTLLEIAKQMPATTGLLRRLMNRRHPYVDNNLGSIVSIIKRSMQNAEAFEAAVSFLKDERSAKVSEETSVVHEETGDSKTTIASAEAEIESEFVSTKLQKDELAISSKHSKGSGCKEIDDLRAPESMKDQSRKTSLLSPGEVIGAIVQVQKKPSRAFGALFGNKTAKKQFDLLEKDKQEGKLKQIRASVQFPFHSLPNTVAEPPAMSAPISKPNSSHSLPIDTTEAILDDFETDQPKVPDSEIDQDEPMSLAELSRSFQQCLDSSKKAVKVDKAREAPGSPLKPFDYEAARKQVVFGDELSEADAGGRKGGKAARGSKGNKSNKTSGDGKAAADEDGEFGEGMRRKAFPATGNRSATFL